MSSCCSGIDNLALQYVRELAVVLRTRNLDAVKRFYRKWEAIMNMDPMPDDRQLEIDMHKMICELPALEDLHEESLEFLKANGETYNVRSNICASRRDPGSCGRKPFGQSETRFQA